MEMDMTAEEITQQYGERCPDVDHDCACCQMWSMYDKIEELTDKVDGLESDLESAVEVAFKRGADEWTRLNYPNLYWKFAA